MEEVMRRDADPTEQLVTELVVADARRSADEPDGFGVRFARQLVAIDGVEGGTLAPDVAACLLGS